jgi:excisionase family DNA binding protein
MPTELMTYDELCARYGFKRGTVYSMVHEGRIPHIRLGPRFVRFEVSAIDAWIRSHRVDSEPASQSPDAGNDEGRR